MYTGWEVNALTNTNRVLIFEVADELEGSRLLRDLDRRNTMTCGVLICGEEEVESFWHIDRIDNEELP